MSVLLSIVPSAVKGLLSNLLSDSAADDDEHDAKTHKVKKKSKIKKKTPASSSGWADISLPLSIIIFISGLVVYILERYQKISLDDLIELSAFADDALLIVWIFFTILMFYHFLLMLVRKRQAARAEAERADVELAEFQKQIEFVTVEEYALLLYCYQRNIKSFRVTLIDKTVKGIVKKALLGLDMKLFINGYYQEADFLERLNQLDGRTAYAEEEEIYSIKYDLVNTRDHMLDIQEYFNADVIDEMHRICKDYLYDIRSKPKKLLSNTQPVTPEQATEKGEEAPQ